MMADYEKIKSVQKELNWIKNNLDRNGKYVKPFNWCGSDMFIDLYSNDYISSDIRNITIPQTRDVKGNLINAYIGKSNKKVTIDPTKTIISKIKYFKDGYMHYMDVSENIISYDIGVPYNTKNSDFRIKNSHKLIMRVSIDCNLICSIAFNYDPDNGCFILTVENAQNNTDVLICGVKLNMTVDEDVDSNISLYEVMRKKWNNNYIVEDLTSLDEVRYSEILFTVFGISNIKNFRNRALTMIVNENNKIHRFPVDLDNRGRQTINIDDIKNHIRSIEINLTNSALIVGPDRCQIIITGNDLNTINSILFELKE